MPSLQTNDGINLYYATYGDRNAPPLILLHGFTGSSEVFSRNISALSEAYYVVTPDLRGHGRSDKLKAGYHVARLAMDLHHLIATLDLESQVKHSTDGKGGYSAIGTSLGAAILWSYAELFTTSPFDKLIFVDQAPLQNYISDWGPELGNRGCNTPETLATFQHTLENDPKAAHLGTVAACLGYRSHPRHEDPKKGSKAWEEDEKFFLERALKGDGKWYGKLMADHTALDWRDSIAQNFGRGSRSTTQVLVVASSRSGCFPAAGPRKVVELVNGGEKEGLASGVTIGWGGHWCYWEDPERFNALALGFLSKDKK